MKPSKLITQVIAIVITVLAGVAFAAANNWTPPAGIPPAGNVDAPVNVSGTAQEKLGGLILGSGLGTSQSALYIPTANILLGTTAPSAAPNGQGSNIDVNDIYIRSSGKWASTLAAATPPATCTPTDWSPVVVPSNVCSGSVATQVKTNADCTTSAQSINGTKDCSTPPAGPTAGTWFNNQLSLDSGLAYNQWNGWAGVIDKTFVTAYKINKIRINGYADDAGYCYAYSSAGTGNAFSVYAGNGSDGVYGIYNKDNTGYPYTYGLSYSGPTCDAGDTVNYYPAYNTGGDMGSDMPESWDCTKNCPVSSPTADDRGNAQLCLGDHGYGAVPTVVQDVNFPAGSTITLQGRYTTGPNPNSVRCTLDIQYAP